MNQKGIKMMNDLKETIGIDKTELADFDVISMDLEKISKYSNVILESKADMNYITQDGIEFGRLQINDNNEFGTMLIEIRKKMGSYYVYTRMDVYVGDSYKGNLNNISVKEYKEKVQNIQIYLFNKYGVNIDISSIKIRNIEINCTFQIEDEFYKYHRPLRLVMYNLSDDSKKTMVVEKNNKQEQRLESETFCYGNSRWKLKVYDKKRQLYETIGYECDIYIMRIEITLLGLSKVREVFKTNLLADITDKKIQDYYISQFRKLIEQKYIKWQKHNQKLLQEKIILHKKLYKNAWQKKLLSECRDLEMKNRVPIILEIEDVLQQVKLLEKKKNGRHYARVEKEILANCNENDVYIQKDGKRIKEIINKVNEIALVCGEVIKSE